MAVNTPQFDLTPFTSSVPVVQTPPLDLGGTQPAGPLPGQFGGHRKSGALAIGDSILKGLIKGHEFKAQKKATEAQATISAANAASESAYQKYQDALSQAGGNVDDPGSKAAYDAYQGIFNKGKEAIAPFVIPEKEGKKPGGSKDGKKKEGMLGGIHDFFAANPHIVPQIALMSMQPKPQGQSREAQLQGLQMKEAEQNIRVGEQNIALNDQNIAANREKEQNAKLDRQVEEKGGVDAVLADNKAPSDLKMAANRIKYSALDAQSPEGRMKFDLQQKVLKGDPLSPQERMVAGEMGIVPKPEAQTITGKNGHQQLVWIDPSNGQPASGMKPLDLGPPQWAQEFYAKQAADKNELTKAVQGDPAAWGVKVTGDLKADRAAIDAKVSQLYVKASFGIQNLSEQFGKTGYEVQRDNEQLQGLMKELGLDGKTKNSWVDQQPPTLTYPDGKTTAVGRDYMGAILHQFITKPGENAGVMAYRDTPLNPDGKSPEVIDAERKFAYQFVKNHLMTQKGKLAMTEAQADAFLKGTALGRPVAAPKPGLGAPPQIESTGDPEGGPAAKPGLPARSAGLMNTFGFGPPPAVGGSPQPEVKLYMVPGVQGPVQLTSDDIAKLKANNIPVEEMSPELMNQFLGR